MSESEDTEVSWFKKNKKGLFLVIVFLIFLVIILPILINCFLYFDIETNNSTDGEWLSFWGSFLGGLFGGIATLAAILIQRQDNEELKKDNEELKKSIKKEREPKIIPIKKMQYLYKRSEISYMFNDIQTPSCNLKFSESTKIKLVNVGKEAAIQIEMSWEKPTKIIKSDYFAPEDFEVCKAFSNNFQEIENIKMEKEYIASLEEVELLLHSYTDRYIIYLVDELINKFRENSKKGIYIRSKIQVGTITIKCKNIYDQSSETKYDMEISIFETNRTDELYTIYIEFKLK